MAILAPVFSGHLRAGACCVFAFWFSFVLKKEGGHRDRLVYHFNKPSGVKIKGSLGRCSTTKKVKHSPTIKIIVKNSNDLVFM
tara:strand:- start:122 stop:370 length:249 start_codon:yes stop_codon:yes gene_type:complete